MEECIEERYESEKTSEKIIDRLAANMEGRLVFSADTIDWIKAGKSFKHAALFKLASGRPIHKEQFEEVMGGIWKLDEHANFFKVEKD